MLNKILKIKLNKNNITERMLEEERNLESKRWFDYRGKNLDVLNLFFLAAYVFIYQKFYAKTHDIRISKEVIPEFIKFENDVPVLDEFQTCNLVMARHMADFFGCKYDFYIRSAFDRNIEFGWHYFPNLEHLGYRETAVDVGALWEERKKSTLQLACLGMMDSPTLDTYHDYLIEQVNARSPAIRGKIIERLTRDGHLPKITTC